MSTPHTHTHKGLLSGQVVKVLDYRRRGPRFWLGLAV